MRKLLLISLTIAALLALAGCQETIPANTDNSGQEKRVETPVVDHGLPSSNGPSSEPETMKGPSAPPPEITPTEAAQSVTTKENIRLTLPIKNN